MRDFQSDSDVDSISFEYLEQDIFYRCIGEFSVWFNYILEIFLLCLVQVVVKLFYYDFFSLVRLSFVEIFLIIIF